MMTLPPIVNASRLFAVVGLTMMTAQAAVAVDGSSAEVTLAAEILPVAIEDTEGSAERLEAADRLRTLSQEVASAACHLYNTVAPDESLRLMTEAKVEVNQILDALEHGDPTMGIIGEEHRRKTLVAIENAREIWAPMYAALLEMLEDPNNTDAITTIKGANEAFYDASSLLLSELAGEYANPFELTQLDALLINISGRQSMLTQKIAKEACEIWTGNRSQDRLTALQDSVDMFHLGINALHDGLPQLGIIPAPTPEIKVGLEEIVADWAIVKSDLDAILGGDVSDEIKADLYLRLNEKMYKMDKIVHLYTVYAHHQY